MEFSGEEREQCRRLVREGLREDLGDAGDVTTRALITPEHMGKARMVARGSGVLAGLEAAELVYGELDANVRLERMRRDGERVESGYTLARLAGPAGSILSGERLALNFVQRLSGIATLTRRYVDAVAGTAARIYDTRKTTPGWRALEKYAVRAGGGFYHRSGLFDAVLIKDNHLAVLAELEPGWPAAERIGAAVKAARAAAPAGTVVEVEVESLEELDAALEAEADLILLDNFPVERTVEAVRRRNARRRGTGLEASGGITLENVAAVAGSGVERISIGALTHSAAALDIALDWDHAQG